MEHVPVSMPEAPSEQTRPSTGSSFYSGVASPCGSSEDEFFDAPESLSSQGNVRSISPNEPRISTPLVSTDIMPTISPIISQPNFPVIPESTTPMESLPNLLEQLNGFRATNRTFPSVRDDDFSSLESVSETETITPLVNRHMSSSPSDMMETVLTEETVIPDCNGGTTNILTFLSPNPDSAAKQFSFRPIDKVS